MRGGDRLKRSAIKVKAAPKRKPAAKRKRSKWDRPRCKCCGQVLPLTKRGYSKRARKHLRERCEVCGTPHKLVAHHVDQQSQNTTAANIQTLCRECHDYWHMLAKRRGHSVAGRMPRLRRRKASK
jgi:hypothetical protein